jgi:hypothetical protein
VTMLLLLLLLLLLMMMMTMMTTTTDIVPATSRDAEPQDAWRLHSRPQQQLQQLPLLRLLLQLTSLLMAQQ